MVSSDAFGGRWELVTSSVGGGASDLYVLSTDTAAATLLAPIDATGIVGGLAYSSSGELFGTTTDTDQLYKIRPVTGQARLVGAVGTIDLAHGLAFDDRSGSLYATFGEDGQNNLFRVDPATADATLVGGIVPDFGRGLSSVSALDFHPTIGELYGGFGGPGSFGALITIDTQTAMGTLVGLSHRLTGIAFHPESGVLYGVDNGSLSTVNSSLYTIDLNTGAASLIGEIPLSNTLGLEFVQVVPEPATLQAVCILACCIGVYRWARGMRD